jgi:hypothetical protein
LLILKIRQFSLKFLLPISTHFCNVIEIHFQYGFGTDNIRWIITSSQPY